MERRRSPTAIVVVVNPMPRLYIESLAAELQGSFDVRILSCYRGPLLTDSQVASLHHLGAVVRQYSRYGKLGHAADLLAAARTLRGWLAESSEVHAFVCQPNHLLTNYLVFGDHGPTEVSCHLIPDGTANYYRASAEPYRATMRTKRRIAPLLGLRFHPYAGDYLGVETGRFEDYWYIGLPGRMAKDLPVKRFGAGRLGAEPMPSSSDWLFVGQPLPAADGVGSYREVLAAASLVFGPGGHYRPHPAETIDKGQRNDLQTLGYTVLTPDAEPAEIVSTRYANVVGVASSVLFNLAALGWHAQVWAVTDPTLLRELTGRSECEVTQVIQAASELGINALPLPRGPG